MIKKLSYYIVVVLLLTTSSWVYAYIPTDDLTIKLERSVDAIESLIQRRWEYVRNKVLSLLQDHKTKSLNDEYIFVMNYLIEEIENPIVGVDDFTNTYENINIVMIPSQIIATVVNEGALGQRNDDAFDYLAWFIFGDNTNADQIAMTSPVTRSQINEWSYESAFIMPEGRTLNTLPLPNNDRVQIKEMPWSLQAVWRFSWYTNEAGVAIERELFSQELEKEGIRRYWLPTLAQYDGPWVRPQSRRNELRVKLNP